MKKEKRISRAIKEVYNKWQKEEIPPKKENIEDDIQKIFQQIETKSQKERR